MIRYLHNSEIDKSRWDACIDQSVYSIIYGYSWYLDIISPGWDALVDDDYGAVFPLTWKQKFGISYLTQPCYAQQLGIFSKETLSCGQIISFIKAIPEKYWHFDLYLNPQNGIPYPSNMGFRERKTYHVPLHLSYPEIAERYTTDTKKNLKAIAKRNLSLKPIDPQQVIELYKQNVWHKTPGLKQCDFSVLPKLVKEVSSRKECIILGVYENDVLSAGTIFFKSQDKIIYIFGASNAAGRKNGAMRFVFDQIIRNYCNNKLVLDFEGSSVDSVEHFYKSLGSDKVTFLNILHSKFDILGTVIKANLKISNQIAKWQIIHQNAD